MRPGEIHLSRALLLSIGLLIALPAPVRAGTNLIRNGGFEEGPGEYPGVGKYWETNDGQPHPAINGLTGETKHAGNWSQWLKAHSTWDLGAVRQVSAYNSVTPGKTYRIQAWIKTANVGNPAGWYVFGLWWFQGDAYLGDSKMPRQETNNYDWRLISWTAVAPPGADRVAAVLTRHTDGDVWYDDVFIGEESPGTPEIVCMPPTFDRRVRRGGSLPDDSFTIHNAGGGTLNYTVASDVSWITVSPESGISTGDVNICVMTYSVSSLAVSEYVGSLTVIDPAAVNSPQTVRVTLRVTIPGDFNLDGDVDLEDFGTFQICYSGPGVPQLDAACSEARLDDDTDVDLDDFALWQTCFSGPAGPVNPVCTGH